MRPYLVVVFSPLIDLFLGVLQGPKPVLVQAFIAELSIQAFYKSVLGRLPRLNKCLPGSALLSPIEHGLARKLRPVIRNYRSWELPLLAKLGQKARDAVSRDLHAIQLPDHFS